MQRENFDRTASERCIDKFLYKAVKENKAHELMITLLKKVKLNEHKSEE